MKNKKLLIVLMIVTSSIMVSCSTEISSEDKVIDSIVIDEDAKETANSNNKINITKIATTENLNGTIKGAVLTSNGKLIQIKLKENLEADKAIQFPKEYIENLAIGTITDEIQNNRNVVTWENKDIDGQLIREYMGTEGKYKILKNNKVYALDENYNLKEVTAYKKLIEKTNADIYRFELSYDKNLEIYYTDNSNERVIIDTLNDEYYEIDSKVLDKFTNRQKNILMAENNRIYVSIVDVANKEKSTIGYIENNKLTTFLDENSAIKVRVTGDVIYNNDNILFSGYVEDDYGIWSYNIETKKLKKQLQLKYDYSYFKISTNKEFIIITNTNSYGDYDISIARVNDDLEISNFQELTNFILPSISDNKWLNIVGWSNSGNRFFVNCIDSIKIDGAQIIDDVYYEIYEVK